MRTSAFVRISGAPKKEASERSAFGVRADMASAAQNVSYWHKRTSACAPHMSPFDPKRTSPWALFTTRLTFRRVRPAILHHVRRYRTEADKIAVDPSGHIGDVHGKGLCRFTTVFLAEATTWSIRPLFHPDTPPARRTCSARSSGRASRMHPWLNARTFRLNRLCAGLSCR